MSIDPDYIVQRRQGWLEHQQGIRNHIDFLCRHEFTIAIPKIAFCFLKLEKLKEPGNEANPHLAHQLILEGDFPIKIRHYVKALFEFIKPRR